MKPFYTLLLSFLIGLSTYGQSIEQSDYAVAKKSMIFSSVLGEEREIYIYKPAGLWGMDERQENLPVIYVLDGESQFLQTVATIDYLSAAPQGNDLMPRAIVVGIPNVNRNRDLTPIKGMMGRDTSTISKTGGGPFFLKFITDELIPHIDTCYHTCSHRTIIGHSLGGQMAMEALLRARNHFDNYVAIDPGFGFADGKYMQEVLDTLRIADLSSENLFFAAANSRPSFITFADLPQDTSMVMSQIDGPNFEFINTEDAYDWSVNLSMKYYADENHFSVPQLATVDAFRAFYSYYPFKPIMDYYHPRYADRHDLLPRLIDHYEMISDTMGCVQLPMQGYLNSFAFGLSHAGRGDLAEDLLKYNISLHLTHAKLYNNLGYYYKNENRLVEAKEQFTKSLSLKSDENIALQIEELNEAIEKAKPK